MKLLEFLDSKKVKYELTTHRPTFTAQQMAAEEHIPGINVAKPVLVRGDGKLYMCVLPACCKIDLDALKQSLGVKKVRLADESEMAEVFGDCQLGAEPPLGNLYNLPTLMDKTLENDEYIICQAGSHEKAVRISLKDYKKIAEPKILAFSYHTS
jgi:Ala-tRNA(Pro) deacylase